jgi:ferredoxin
MTNMSPAREKGLRRLAQLMNTRHRNPLPVTKPLLDCFDVALSDQELAYLLEMGTDPVNYEKAAAISGMPEEAFRPFFERLGRKGLIWPKANPGGEDLFVLPGIMLGWFEIFLASGEETAEKREFARRLDLLFKSFEKLNTFPFRSLINRKMRRLSPQQSIIATQGPEEKTTRTIPVNRPVRAGAVKIYPAKTVQELIEKQSDENSIAAVHCFCRQYHKMVEEPCRFQHPPQSCLAIGDLAGHAAKYGGGRIISKGEALALVQELQQKGAVHQVFHEDEDVDKPEIAICNCCWDCCGVLGSYNRGLFPLVFKSYFEARVSDPTTCTACEECLGYCPVEAVTMQNGRSRVDSSKCIGCGQCETHCLEDVFTLVPNERTVMLPLRKRSNPRIPL